MTETNRMWSISSHFQIISFDTITCHIVELLFSAEMKLLYIFQIWAFCKVHPVRCKRPILKHMEVLMLTLDLRPLSSIKHEHIAA